MYCCQASSIQSHCRCFLVSDSLNKQWNTYSCKPACLSKTAFWKGRCMVSERTLMKLGSCVRIRANLGLRERVGWRDGSSCKEWWEQFIDTLLILFALLLTEFVGDSHQPDRGKRRTLFPLIHRLTSVPFYSFFPPALCSWVVTRDRVWDKHPSGARSSENFPWSPAGVRYSCHPDKSHCQIWLFEGFFFPVAQIWHGLF